MTRVEHIEMTAGFTHRLDGHDLFTENLRIREVRVEHAGETVVATLDPESRELQRIDVSGEGGLYRVVITETVPGTRRSYREVCVSDLRVMGAPPADVEMGSPDLLLGAVDTGVPFAEIREARAEVMAHPDTPEAWASTPSDPSSDAWRRSVETLQRAFAVRCGDRRLEGELLTGQRRYSSAVADRARATEDYENGGECPEGASPDECAREEEERFQDTGAEHHLASGELMETWTAWFDHCRRALGVSEDLDLEGATPEQLRFVGYVDALDPDLL